MSVWKSVTSPDQIRKSPNNTSSSKFAFTFSKKKRFDDYKCKCPQVSYCSSSKTNKGTSFGYGQRVSFVNANFFTPQPCKYNTVKRKSFGLSRKDVKHSGYIPLGPIQNPSPNDYNKNRYETQKKNNFKYSMRPKTKVSRDYFINNIEASMVPGPGAYQSYKTLDKQGKYFISKFKNSRATFIGKNKRFFQKCKTPGPSDYKIRINLNGEGNTGCRLFGKDSKKCFTDVSLDCIVPGPGSYRLNSQFGHYQNLLNDVHIK